MEHNFDFHSANTNLVNSKYQMFLIYGLVKSIRNAFVSNIFTRRKYK